MKLCYHEGQNFGDALNPLIFNHYLPDFFDDDPEEIFLGIGSILGLKKGCKDTKRITVFSSGYAAGADKTYGKKPKIDNKYNIVCVRGPLTAKYLNIPQEKAVADGAILIRTLKLKSFSKTHSISFMPHIGSENVYNWKKLIDGMGVNYISPKENIIDVVEQIKKSEILVTEAMHGAIVADSFRIPWVPIKCYPTINTFKWRDYCESIKLKYTPIRFNPLYSEDYIKLIINNKYKIINDNYFINKSIKLINKVAQMKVKMNLHNMFNAINNIRPCLSDEKLLNDKIDILTGKLLSIERNK